MVLSVAVAVLISAGLVLVAVGAARRRIDDASNVAQAMRDLHAISRRIDVAVTRAEIRSAAQRARRELDAELDGREP